VLTVFYNPVCSKCRRVRHLLDERGEQYELIEYLETPPDRARIESLLAMLDSEPATLVRREQRIKELGISDSDCSTRAQVLELLVAHPELLERPVVVRGRRAIVARPPERVLELLD
jgi:arsenate reductase